MLNVINSNHIWAHKLFDDITSWKLISFQSVYNRFACYFICEFCIKIGSSEILKESIGVCSMLMIQFNHFMKQSNAIAKTFFLETSQWLELFKCSARRMRLTNKMRQNWMRLIRNVYVLFQLNHCSCHHVNAEGTCVENIRLKFQRLSLNPNFQ